jgi:hypothetical protein
VSSGGRGANNWVTHIAFDEPSAVIDLEHGRELKRVDPCVIVAGAVNSQ